MSGRVKIKIVKSAVGKLRKVPFLIMVYFAEIFDTQEGVASFEINLRLYVVCK